MDLGAIRPTGINNSTEIIGAIDASDGTTKAAVWQNGTITRLKSLNGPFERATAINDTGQIVGQAGGTSKTTEDFHAAVWGNVAATQTLLPQPTGHTDSFTTATGINLNGDIVGRGSKSDSTFEGIAWPKGAAAGVVFSGLANARDIMLWTINASGQVTGVSSDEIKTFISEQLLYTLGQPTVPQDLKIVPGSAFSPHIPATTGSPAYINNAGMIAGTLTSGSDAQGFAYFRATNGTVTQITKSTSTTIAESESTGINASGTVSININPDETSGTPTAAVFDTTNGLRTLTDLILPTGSGWTLTNTGGINDKGQIVGTGTFQGTTHGFLLNPVTVSGT